MKGLFRYEWKKLLADKRLFAGACIAIVLVIVVLSIVFWAPEVKPIKDWEEGEREERLASYVRQRDRLYENLQTPENWSEAQLIQFTKDYELYKYYVETQTTDRDYLSNNYTDKTAEYAPDNFMLYLGSYGYWVLIAVALLFGVLSFSTDIASGTLKNVLAANKKRGEIFVSRALFYALILLALFLAVFAVGLIAGAAGGGSKFLVYNGHYRAISAFHLFAELTLGSFFVAVTLYSLTLLFGVLTKRPIFAVCYTVAAYMVCIVFSMVCAGQLRIVALNFQKFDLGIFVPFAGLQNYSGGFDAVWAIMSAVHVVVTSLLVYLSWQRFKKLSI